jgi:hypothetical protein
VTITKSKELVGSWTDYKDISTASTEDKKMLIAWKTKVEAATNNKFTTFEPEKYKT